MNHEHRPLELCEVGKMSDRDKRSKQLVPKLTLAENEKEEMPITGFSLGSR